MKDEAWLIMIKRMIGHRYGKLSDEQTDGQI